MADLEPVDVADLEPVDVADLEQPASSEQEEPSQDEGTKGTHAGWPEWLQKYIRELETLAGPVQFQEVVKKLATQEILMGFPHGQVCDHDNFAGFSDHTLQGESMTLSKVGRPDVIGRWILGGCKVTPVIEDLPAFVTLWRKWWISLQPSSQVKQGRKLCQAVDDHEEWEELQKGSINGFFTVIISLSWWLTAAKTAAQHKIFLEVVEDVSWVQDQIIARLKPSLKRGHKDEGEVQKAKRFVF